MAIAVAVILAMISLETSKQAVALTGRTGLPPAPNTQGPKAQDPSAPQGRRARGEDECNRDELDSLRAILKEIEGSRAPAQIRAAGWILGAFPADHWLHKQAHDLSRIRAQMTASQAPSDAYAFSIASMFACRSDLSSRLAEQVLKTAWSGGSVS